MYPICQLINWIHPPMAVNSKFMWYRRSYYFMDETIQRILMLIDNSGMSDKQILKELDMQNSSTLITDWRTGRSKSPQIKHIVKLAEYFKVTTDYLLTGKVQETDLQESEQNLIHLFRSLPDLNQKQVTGYIEGQFDAINNKKP